MGQPPRWEPYVAPSALVRNDLWRGMLTVGGHKHITHPTVGLLGVAGEAYGTVEQLMLRFFVLVLGLAVPVSAQQSVPTAAGERDFTPEEILTRRFRQGTTYQYFGSLGFSYSFGSIFNNVVNPRMSD